MSEVVPMSSKLESKPAAAPAARRFVACVAAALIPGAGHAVLGRYGRALTLFLAICGMALLGVAMHGHVFAPGEADGALMLVYTVGQIGCGLSYVALRALRIGLDLQYKQPTFEYGTHFLVVAGLLNYLVILDAFDIARGRKS
jgi:hypothetical protein